MLEAAIAQRQVARLEAALSQGDDWLASSRGSVKTTYEPQVTAAALALNARQGQSALWLSMSASQH